MRIALPAQGLLLVLVCVSVSAPAAEKTAWEAITELAGDYTGHWDEYALNKVCQLQLVSSYDDEISLTNPQRGQVPNSTDPSTFGVVTNLRNYTFPEVKTSAPIKLQEGFRVNSDGTASEHYFAYEYMPGKFSLLWERQVGPNLWTMETSIYKLNDFACLGIDDANKIEAKNLTVKTTTYENGLEIQTVVQTTLLTWRASDGTIKSKQFVSRNGFHKRSSTH